MKSKVNAGGMKLMSTPVDDEVHNCGIMLFNRYSADLDKYNKIAKSVMDEKEVEPIRKLHAAFIAGYLMG